MTTNDPRDSTSQSTLHLGSFLDTEPTPLNSHFVIPPQQADDDDDRSLSEFSSDNENDTASQRSISLSSPPRSPVEVEDTRRQSLAFTTFESFKNKFTSSISSPTSPQFDDSLTTPTAAGASAVTPIALIRDSLTSMSSGKRESQAHTLSSESSSYPDNDDEDDRSLFMRRLGEDIESPLSSAASSVMVKDKEVEETKFVPTPIPSLPSFRTLNLRSTSSVKPPAQSPSAPLRSFPPRPVVPSNAQMSPPLGNVPWSPPSSAAALVDRQEVRESKSSYASSVMSVSTTASTYSKKARPESLLTRPTGPLVHGIALVDFNHLVGPKIEFSRGAIFDNEEDELTKILPFLALPDGAHLTSEDFSYFHLVSSLAPNPTTLFGISCNRQIRTADLLTKHPDVTRSTVQKAVVILATKPVFGPIRDRLGVITRALFEQRDFSDLSILDDFYQSLEGSLKSQLTESGLYMGTSLRELVHTFRQRTLVLLKALLLQKKIMLYGHPVEKLCTYQYSLVALVPGLLHNLDDCGSPPLAARSKSLSRPTELKTSDTKSMTAFVGLPLDLFGKDAFFQPYLPLQQMDMLKDTQSWLCGSTNSIVAQREEVDLLINIETNTFEFRDPQLEKSAGLTPADRKWMDDIVKDVNESWTDGEEMGGGNVPPAMFFKGSEDYVRQKFDEYIVGALSSVKYADFLAKGQGNGVVISDGSGDPNAVQDFGQFWISEFKKTNAYEVWDRVTDPLLFDIVEPRHPCNERPSVVADISIRLTEGIQELDQQLAPTREAINRTITAGSASFLKAVEGVRDRWWQRSSGGTSSENPPTTPTSDSGLSPNVSPRPPSQHTPPSRSPRVSVDGNARPLTVNGMRPLSLMGSVSGSPRITTASLPPPPPAPATTAPPPPATPDQGAKAPAAAWGSGIASFFSARTARFSSTPTTPTTDTHKTSPSLGGGIFSTIGGGGRSSSPSTSSTSATTTPIVTTTTATPPRRGSGSSSIISFSAFRKATPPATIIESPISITSTQQAIMTTMKEPKDEDLGIDELQPRDLDKEYAEKDTPPPPSPPPPSSSSSSPPPPPSSYRQPPPPTPHSKATLPPSLSSSLRPLRMSAASVATSSYSVESDETPAGAGYAM